MKSNYLFNTILVIGILLFAFSIFKVYGQTPAPKVKVEKMEKMEKSVMYTCPMHPEVVKDHPGKCPKCGMDLVVKKDKPKKDMHQKKDSTMMKKDMEMKKSSTPKMKNKSM